jgi:hypothetical protein
MGVQVQQREKTYNGILMVNEQRSCASPSPESRRPERFLIAVEEKDFEAICESIVQLLDLAIKTLRPVSAHDQQT